MKLNEITKLKDTELAELIAKSHRDLADTIVSARTKEDANVRAQRGFKRTIARALTIQRQRQLATEEGQA